MSKREQKAETRRRFALRVVLYFVISLALAAGVYLWNAQTLGGDRMPMPFGRGAAVVLSGSMEPVLSANDLVFVKAAERYEPGDIVVYQAGGELIIHRIQSVSSDGSTVVTKGDANSVPDSPISVSAIKGKMTGSIPRVGGLVLALRSPIGVLAILAACAALMIFSGRTERRKPDEESCPPSEDMPQEQERRES